MQVRQVVVEVRKVASQTQVSKVVGMAATAGQVCDSGGEGRVSASCYGAAGDASLEANRLQAASTLYEGSNTRARGDLRRKLLAKDRTLLHRWKE